MVIRFAKTFEAPLIHNLMIKAFMEYRNEIAPSSALGETVQSVSEALEDGEKALIAFEGNNPVGMVRFQIRDDTLNFYRLSVVPEEQGKGIAKEILKSLEDYAKETSITSILCEVRMKVRKNIDIYKSVGYEIYDEDIVHKPNGINIKVAAMKKEL